MPLQVGCDHIRLQIKKANIPHVSRGDTMMATETVQIELYTRFKNLVSINKTNKKKKKGKKIV